MTKNMGMIDRGLRLAVAVLLLIAAFTTDFAGAGPIQWLAITVAAVFAVTAAVGNCPLYRLVGIKTCRSS